MQDFLVLTYQMRMDKYPATYLDNFQSYQNLWIHNTGEVLYLDINGLILKSTDFDTWEICPNYLKQKPDWDKIKRFERTPQGYLKNYTLRWQMPLLCLNKTSEAQTIQLFFNYREAKGKGFDLSFEWAGKYHYLTEMPDYEALLLKIQSITTLTPRNCFGCKWSDYSVYGQSAFGSLMCFQHIRDIYPDMPENSEYQHYKDYYMDCVMDNYERYVQETYCCPNFTPRPTGIGYRG